MRLIDVLGSAVSECVWAWLIDLWAVRLIDDLSEKVNWCVRGLTKRYVFFSQAINLYLFFFYVCIRNNVVDLDGQVCNYLEPILIFYYIVLLFYYILEHSVDSTYFDTYVFMTFDSYVNQSFELQNNVGLA